nr:ABC transporter substrate-binding protein [uncultured Devosia sp.]
MIFKSLLAVTTLGLVVTTALAQETRSVTDHAGYQVEVPVDPQRIVSLNDWTTSVMVHELSGNMVGSGGRLDAEGNAFVRSGLELFGLAFDDTLELASIHGELDVERIAALKPDLIVALQSDTIAYRDQLASIAPILLFDAENGQDPLVNYADFAAWLGKEARYEELNAAYEARIAAFKAQHGNSHGSFISLLPNPQDGNITVYSNYGAVTEVLEDIGFTRHPMMDQVPATDQRALISPELVGEMNADYIVSTHIVGRGQSTETLLADLETVAPGSSGFLAAVQNDRFISFSRFHVYPPIFAAMDVVLDELAEKL